MAKDLLAEHGLTADGWVFRFDRATRRLGLCNYTHRIISLSRSITTASTAEAVQQTLLHEVAHALVGHGPVWKAKARSIGYLGERCAAHPLVERSAAQFANETGLEEAPQTRREYLHPGKLVCWSPRRCAEKTYEYCASTKPVTP